MSPGSRLLLLLRTFSPLSQLPPRQAWSLVPVGPSGSLFPASSLHDTQPTLSWKRGSADGQKERPFVLTLGGHLCCLNEGGPVFPMAVGPTGRVAWSGIGQVLQGPFLGSRPPPHPFLPPSVTHTETHQTQLQEAGSQVRLASARSQSWASTSPLQLPTLIPIFSCFQRPSIPRPVSTAAQHL